MPSYGVAKCLTIAQEIPAATELSVKVNGVSFACSNTDTTQCQYEQLASASFPAVSSIAASGNEYLEFTGTNFFTTGYTASVAFNSIEASSVEIVSDTLVRAKWDGGVPIHSSVPTLSFKDTTLGHEYHAMNT